MKTITIQDLAQVLADKKKLEDRVSRLFVSTMFEVVRDAVEEEKLVKVKGLGTFKLVEVGARESVSVNNGERVTIDSHGKVTFTPDTIMKELVNKPFSQFETVVLNEGVDFNDLDSDIDESDAVADESDGETESDAVTADGGMDGGTRDDAFDESVPEGSGLQDGLGEDGSFADEESDGKPQSADTDDETDAVAVADETAPADTGVEDSVSSQPFDGEPESDGDALDVATAGGDGHAEDVPAVEIVSEEAAADDIQENSVAMESVADEPESDDAGSLEAGHKKRHGVIYALLWGICVLALMAGSAYVGFLYGRHELHRSSLTEMPSAAKSAPTQVSKQEKPAAERDDASGSTSTEPQGNSLGGIETVAALSDSTDAVSGEAVLHESLRQEQATVAASVVDPEVYEKMDNRVRTGAYRIIGTDTVVKVKKGETLIRISDRMLGRGMVCYVEVYNGITPGDVVKEGQSIKIPKLELKKKRSR